MRYFIFLLPVLFYACTALKHQAAVDRELEDVAIQAAKEGVKALGEDNQDRDELRREKAAAQK